MGERMDARAADRAAHYLALRQLPPCPVRRDLHLDATLGLLWNVWRRFAGWGWV